MLVDSNEREMIAKALDHLEWLGAFAFARINTTQLPEVEYQMNEMESTIDFAEECLCKAYQISEDEMTQLREEHRRGVKTDGGID